MVNNDKYSLADGVFEINRVAGVTNYGTLIDTIDVYCIFDTNNYGWTLIQSGDRDEMQTGDLRTIDFTKRGYYNMNDVLSYKNSKFRVSLEWMESLHSHSTLFSATCNFNTSLSQDWVLMNLTVAQYDPFEVSSFAGVCTSVISANIRGYDCIDSTIQTWQNGGQNDA